ncbi:hypothetical protein AB0O68_15770 [Streptomyces sp. NPDC087512]|uniref:hypothetical protein n=1 Tax=Streptomyces sp. NPDC087512 TaxID=3155059 RepID=UPI0034302652
MTGGWGVAAGIIGSLLGAAALLGAAVFTSRATKAAARLTSEAQRTTAAVQAEPAQRQADLAAFREIREGLDRRIERQERRIDSLTSLVRAFSTYVSELTGQMRQNGIEPPAPPSRVDEYNRTGV